MLSFLASISSVSAPSMNTFAAIFLDLLVGELHGDLLRHVGLRGEYFYLYCSKPTRNEIGHTAAGGRILAKMKLWVSPAENLNETKPKQLPKLYSN